MISASRAIAVPTLPRATKLRTVSWLAGWVSSSQPLPASIARTSRKVLSVAHRGHRMTSG
jgi:hypothetical protein